jgi:hypothetical protein
MIRFSDNAAPDYLLDLLGDDALAAVMTAAGMTPRPLLPHAGMILKAFLALGSKGGSLLGVLTGATYYLPRHGEFSEQPRVVVLFMHEIPFAAWLRLSETFAQQQFE